MSEKNKKGLAGNENVTGQTLPKAGDAPATENADVQQTTAAIAEIPADQNATGESTAEATVSTVDITDLTATADAGSVTVQQTTAAIDVASFTGKDAKAVKFKVEYPEGYEAQKLMPDGELVEISTELAAHFTSINIGKIVE